jgi:DNA-directed RNA polymerase subunit beta'
VDPYTFAILTENTGTIQFKDLARRRDDARGTRRSTGLSRWVVTDSPDEKRQPTIQIRDDKH